MAEDSFRTDINPAMAYYQAFLLTPELSAGDREFLLLTNNWRGQKLPDRFGELVGQYDNQFRLIRQAAHATVPCDWGIDTSPGPMTLLPQFARAKAVVQMARLRALWDLQKGDQAAACEELVGGLTLGRNVARDGVLIAVLVQLACESIVRSVVVENYYQFTPEALQKLVQGFDAAPPRATVAGSYPSEKAMCLDWFVRKIQELRKEHPTDDTKVMEGIHLIFPSAEEAKGIEDDAWAQLSKAGGGTSDGILRVLEESARVYEQLAAIATLPYAQYLAQVKEIAPQLESSPNPLVAQSISTLTRCRTREFRVLADFAMLHAALEYKLHGEAGLKNVIDPCGQGPFTYQRFVFEGVDRGFQLKSGLEGLGFPHVLIFVEKDGPLFFCDGPKTGQAVEPPKAANASEAFKQRYGLAPK
jgi:hypothetical protein